eukprot:TRINITY_DN3681_c0_g2_i11.p2 TRINITY_DN3681_c0_g2~~TRINITY_DN3681_c0_g2_i11.p2  ORF type:complete len:125 (-),score=0.27 TRINITY_DN3681_c0_g2_i11:86-460(-)
MPGATCCRPPSPRAGIDDQHCERIDRVRVKVTGLHVHHVLHYTLLVSHCLSIGQFTSVCLDVHLSVQLYLLCRSMSSDLTPSIVYIHRSNTIHRDLTAHILCIYIDLTPCIVYIHRSNTIYLYT